MTFDHYTLRLIDENDAQAFFKLINNNRTRLSNYLPVTVETCRDLDSTTAYIHDKIKQAGQKEHYCFVIANLDTQELAGAILLKQFEWSVPKCEIGYFIDQQHEGQGIITKALAETIHYCFNTLQLNKLFLRTATDNFPSRKVAEKNGFVVEGILRNDFKTENGALVNMIYYGLLKEADSRNL